MNTGTDLLGIQQIIGLSAVVVPIDGVDVRRIRARFSVLCVRGANLIFHAAASFLVAYISPELSTTASVGASSRDEIHTATFWIQRGTNHVWVHGSTNFCPCGTTGRITGKVFGVVFCVYRIRPQKSICMHGERKTE